ncbi:MAG: PaaI family thioesterase [Aquabacterium sp.]|uniref:PaaI family thioesterase n=1 Tax=Aquabacterium sp. TaxID=1872578 RepID=UPI002717D7C8|nr:PaaI family thioesterase [Aquabacterium sp.]MDO9006167.1 PaaI family thioesterase [Aquabacterium sp.]
MTDMLAMGRRVLAMQGFSQLLGTELIAYGLEEGVVLRLALRDELRQQNGFAHGGVISYLADNALTFAGGTSLGPAVLTSEYKINYLRPGVGTALLARATVIYAGKTSATCRCDVFSVLDDGSEKLCATAQGTIAKVG